MLPLRVAAALPLLLVAPPLPLGPDMPFHPLLTLTSEQFEKDDGGWIAGGTHAWEWGVPKAHLAPESALWGTVLTGAYPARTCGWLQSPPIALPVPQPETRGIQTLRLAYRQWAHLELGYDGGAVQLSTDGGATWRTLLPEAAPRAAMRAPAVRECLGVDETQEVLSGPAGAAPPAADAWEGREVDLTAYAGREVLLRFVLASDGSVERLGWYVDDVRVEMGVGWWMPRQPHLATASPRSGMV